MWDPLMQQLNLDAKVQISRLPSSRQAVPIALIYEQPHKNKGVAALPWKPGSINSRGRSLKLHQF